MNKYLEKIATTVHLYEHKKTKKQKWIKGMDNPGKDWVKLGPAKHIARGQKLGPKKKVTNVSKQVSRKNS